MWYKLLQHWRWAAIILIIAIGIWGQIGAHTPLMVQARDLLRPMAYQSPIGNPQLALDKQANNSHPASGETITYTLRYSNTQAGSQAFNVYIYDFLPAGMNYVSASPAPISVHDNTLVFTAPSVGPTPQNTTITVQAKVIEESGSLLNHSLVVADGVAPATASTLITVQPPHYELTLSKNGPSAILPGGTIDYTLRCRNTGTAPVDGVVVMDVLPANVAFDTAAPPPDATTPTLSWNVGRLDVGAVWEAVLTTTAPTAEGWLTNTAIAAGQQATMTSTVLSTRVISQAAILDVNKTATPSSLHVGDTVLYTIHYRNQGNQTASGVVLTDTFPAHISVTKFSPFPTSYNSTHAIWNLGNVAPGASGVITITAKVTGGAGTNLLNKADITGNGDAYPDHDEVYITVEWFNLYLPLITKKF